MKRVERIALPSPSPGTERHLVVRRYGREGARPKAYIHASLHADETPPMLVLHHLARMLDEAAETGAIKGEIILVPYANPIGLDQEVGSTHVGRHDLANGANFNRAWPDLSEAVAARIDGKLGSDVRANEALARQALREAAAELGARTPLTHMKRAISMLAADADIVLDCHCDSEALMYLYLSTANWPDGADLHAETGSRATFVSVDPGGGSFEDVWSAQWRKLRERFGEDRLPQGCLAATVEYRGQQDMDDALSGDDARRLYRFLQRRGAVAGDPGPLPAPKGEAVDLEAVEMARAPVAGLVAYRVKLGDVVAAGAHLADIVDPSADDPKTARTPVHSETAGLILSRSGPRFVRQGQVIAKVIGKEKLPGRVGGYLLED